MKIRLIMLGRTRREEARALHWAEAGPEAGDPPALRGLSNARIEALLASDGVRMFAGERPSP